MAILTYKGKNKYIAPTLLDQDGFFFAFATQPFGIKRLSGPEKKKKTLKGW